MPSALVMKMNLYVVFMFLLISAFTQENSALFNQVEEPNWVCSTLHSHIGAKYQKISCNLTLPMLSVQSSVNCEQISWIFRPSAVAMASIAEEDIPVYGLVATMCELQLSNHIEVSLTFTSLTEVHFTTTYYIRWKWNGGNRMHPVQIFMVSCLKPYVTNGYLELNDSDFAIGHMITAHCSEHYRMEVNGKLFQVLQLYCSQSGYWATKEAFRVTPNCSVRVCLKPPDVPNSQVIKYADFGDFIEGTKVYYKCFPHFRMIVPDSDNLTCNQGRWQGKFPSCESTINCPWINTVTNGHCFCESKSDLQLCQPFFPGLHIECVCNEGYQLYGQSIVTCGYNGRWDFQLPDCLQNVEIIQENNNFTGSSSHISMLAIVVATACSVLGVLLLIMIIMVFRRRKPHRLRHCRPSSTQPPYSHILGNSLDEHDRMMLLGYDNCPVALPTYEEAVRETHHARHSPFEPGSQDQVGEYRQLPNIPINLRSNGTYNDETNRHSINTTSTMNRDGISDVFGSIDTVNISVSEASTAVTVDSLDSASTHHSNMSRIAAMGSISSLDSHHFTDNVPLLENRTEEIDNDFQDKPEN